MGMIAWVMTGLALWHFTIWVPDRFWGGIVGCLLAALAGAALSGLVIHGFSVPGDGETSILTSLEAIPGTLVAMALLYAEGARRERVAGAPVVN